MSLSEVELRRIHAWRTRVVRLWLLTMVAAIVVWLVAATIALSATVQTLLALGLLALAAWAAVTMRAGKCPSCGEKIRFAPRIELPSACSRCRVSFYSA